MGKGAKPPVVDDPVRAQALRLGEALRSQRRALGISMVAAAEAAGMSRVTWHRMEKGETGVAFGHWLAALALLGLRMDLALTTDPEPGTRTPVPEDMLPLQIRPADFPQLRQLAWQVHGLDALTPAEALGIYERNWRHLDQAALQPDERRLIDTLRQVFGRGPAGV